MEALAEGICGMEALGEGICGMEVLDEGICGMEVLGEVICGVDAGEGICGMQALAHTTGTHGCDTKGRVTQLDQGDGAPSKPSCMTIRTQAV